MDLGEHDATTLALLYAVLCGQDVRRDEAMDSLQFRLVHASDAEDGPWVYRLPDDLAERLLAADTSDASLAAGWREADLVSEFDADDLTVFLAELRAFFESTRGATVLYWASN